MRSLSGLPATVQGVSWMVVSSFFYALTYLTVRELSFDFTAFEISFFRAAVGVLALLPWLMRAGLGALRTTRHKVYGIRLVATYTGMVCWFYGLAKLPLADATALIFTAPFFTAAMLSASIGERVGIRRWGAIAVGFAGALLIIRPGFAAVTLPVFGLLYTAVAYGASNAATRALAITENPNAVVFYQFALVAPVALVPAALTWSGPGWDDAPMIAAFGLLSMLSMWCMTRALAAAPAAVVMPIFYLQLPLVALLAWLRYGEAPGAFVWIGGAVICAAGYYVAHSESRRERTAARRTG